MVKYNDLMLSAPFTLHRTLRMPQTLLAFFGTEKIPDAQDEISPSLYRVALACLPNATSTQISPTKSYRVPYLAVSLTI